MLLMKLFVALLAILAAACLLVLGEPRVAVLGRNTLIVSASTAALSVLIAAPLAFLVTRTNVPGRRAAAVLLAALVWIPLYLQAAAWQAGFGLQGWYTLTAGLPPLIEGMAGAIWIHTMAAVPWAALVIALGFAWVEPDVEEEASLDASPWHVFRAITLRRSLGIVAAAALLVAVMTAGEMTVTNLLLVRTLAEEIYTQISLGEITVDASALTMPAVILTALSVAGGLYAAASIAPRTDAHAGRRPIEFRLRRRWLAAVALWTALAGIVGVPLVSLLYKSGVLITRDQAGWQRGWSALKSAQMIGGSVDRFASEFGWSFLIGAVATTASLLIGALLAWLAKSSRWGALLVTAVVAVCWALPGPLLGLGIIKAFNQPDVSWLLWLYDYTIAAPVVALVLRALPLTTLILWHAFSTIPREIINTAALDGASSWTTFMRVVLPGRKSALAMAWLVGLAVSIGDLAASILVVPPGVNTLAIEIFGLIHYGVDDQVAGICLLLCGLFSLLAAITLKIAAYSTNHS
jgi:iron(III) transport system permease protein